MRWLIAGVLLVTACHPKSDNIPLEEARNAPPASLAERTSQEVPGAAAGLPASIEAAGQEWLPTTAKYRLPASSVRTVAASGGQSLYVLTWDDAPWDRLLLRTAPDVYAVYEPLRSAPADGGRPTARPAGASTDSAAVRGAPARTQAEH